MSDCIVLGAGAAGLMCAITAARRGRRVTVLERSNKPGKKILMSGGGRCNFTNLHTAPDRFLSANPHFCKSALARYTQWDFIAWVERAGIAYHEKETVTGPSGQLFCDGSSKQIVAMLLDACRQHGVELRLDCETTAVDRTGDAFLLETGTGAVRGDTLVVATGGLSVPSLGGSDIGYRLARQFGLRVLPTAPGLVPLTFTGAEQERFAQLAGISLEVEVACAGARFREDLLFTHRGLSGPAVLQLSSYWRPGGEIRIDLLPGRDAAALLQGWKRNRPRALLRSRLGPLLPGKLLRELEALFWPGNAERPLGDWRDADLAAVAAGLQDWTLKPAATEGYRTAEVTLGGVDTRELSSKSMESRVPGLFFVGEVVDVTGHLGGFNFQWAWSSGHAAGEAV